jgi:benzoyl-CoA reductase/2-hydroxyglutaryl-CoA dehydratase subunit BcrC/BadD/HgdB
MTERYSDYRALIDRFTMTEALVAGNEEYIYRLPTTRALRSWLERVLQAEEQGRTIVWNHIGLVTELLTAFDVAVVNPDIWGLLKVFLRDGHGCVESIDAAHDAGIPQSWCSVQKTAVGDVLRNEVPPPDCVITASFPCDNSKIHYQIVRELTKAPMYVLDCPNFGPDTHQEAALEYWVNQVKQVISFLEEQTGQKLDPDRLKECAEEGNRAFECWLDVVEMRKMTPLPQRGVGPTLLLMADTQWGLPEATAAMALARDDIRQRVEEGKTAIPEEKARLTFFYVPVAYDELLTEWMEEQKGVVAPLNFPDCCRMEPVDTSTTEDIIRGMAKRMLEIPMGRQGMGDVNVYLQDCLYTCREWNIDGVILVGNIGCKWLTSTRGLAQEVLREHGLPSLYFECDIFDPRTAPLEETRGKIEEFIDILVAGKE